MSKEFDIYNPGSWIYADGEEMKYLGFNLIDPSSGSNFSQEDTALLINEIIVKKNLKFTNDREFRNFVNKTLAVMLDNTTEYLDKKYDFEHGIIPSDKSKVFVDGHELTLAQYTLFQMFKLTKEQQFTVVNTWYVCRDQGLRSYQIKQELFLKLHNIDLDFLIAIMKADLLCEEVSVFVDFLFDWVSECESAKEVEEIFNYLYFKLHPEIKKSILEDNLIWGIENNKIFRREE